MRAHTTFSALFIGDGTLLIRCADLFAQAGHELRAVVSSEPLVRRWAEEQLVPCLTPGDWTGVITYLDLHPVDFLFSVSNLAVLPAEVIRRPRVMAVNFHDALLPRYAGMHATSWALLNRERTHGVTWHEMLEEVDTGHILKQRTVDIGPGETALSLNARCYEAGIQSFAELLDDLATSRLAPRDQPLADRSYFPRFKRPEAAAVIGWERPAEEIRALVAALDFGPYANPLGLPKLYLGDAVVAATALEIQDLDGPSAALPGTVVHLGEDVLQVATATADVRVHGLRTLEGAPLTPGDLAAHHSVRHGFRFPALVGEAAERLTAATGALARHEAFWAARLAALSAPELPYAQHSAATSLPDLATPASSAWSDMPPPAELAAAADALDLAELDRGGLLAVLFAGYLARLVGADQLDLGFSEPRLRQELAGLEAFFAVQVPLHVDRDSAHSAGEALRAVARDLVAVRQRKTYARDVVARTPRLLSLLAPSGPRFPVAVEIVEPAAFGSYTPGAGTELTFLVTTDGTACRWLYDRRVYSAADVAAMHGQLARFVHTVAEAAERPWGEVSLLSDDERHTLLVAWNATATDFDRQGCIHQRFEAQVDRTPDAVALVCEDRALTYRDLDGQANQLARHLQALGVGPDRLVGVCLDRSLDLVIALLGIHKAGGAYVPLDPTYPADRLSFMVEDAGLCALVTHGPLADTLDAPGAAVVRLDADRAQIAAHSATRTSSQVRSDHLAYVIYTSGSTGKPKGVMVEHGNVANFFAGMDQRLDHGTDADPAQRVWLAVTSLSFDISVLELLWPLTHGFKVVLYADPSRDTANGAATAERELALARKPIQFSLFYFASDEGEAHAAGGKYTLLLEGARFADTHGFTAVWTPERHFHAFGGLYPNASVASAAIAAITHRVQIRAGSVVLPLHSPIRVAEEWALVDNLSHGRVGISFASGWQPNDFVLAPDHFADRKNVMLRDVETVRKLWRGERVTFPGPRGNVPVGTLPRPVQPELPVWITSAGSTETYRLAGEMGAGVLTHLLGQTVEELAEKLAVYRRAWREAGHAGGGHVTLMLHTLVGEDDERVRETVREPMKAYLRSSVDLIRQAAWTFPTFASLSASTGKSAGELFDGGLSDAEMDALLDYAFERYYRTSGLFGTPHTCLAMVQRLKAIDVDEVACLIDFGVPSNEVLAHLAQLDLLKELSNPGPPALDHVEMDFSLPAQIERHEVTHLQCTPSMARMLLLDERTRASLKSLKQLLVGGEALPVALARELKGLVAGQVINMYGPTETTIWSSTHAVEMVGSSVPIGRPIANTRLYMLDRDLQSRPLGVPGELCIAGEGVARGYLGRPELTAERFLPEPFAAHPAARMYRTGDLARWQPDGTVEFLGRLDHQVKIRGYRIELGEIESLLNEHPLVQEAVVVVREDIPGDQRLVGYVVLRPSAEPTVDAGGELRAYLQGRLPAFMVPSQIVALPVLPLTPNAKIDRHALPPPEQPTTGTRTSYVAPRNETEQVLVQLWQQVLRLETVGVRDNFFELGGHSLLAMHLMVLVRDTFHVQVLLQSFFEAPTAAGLAEVIQRAQIEVAEAEQVAAALTDLDALSDEEVRVLLSR